MGQDLGRDQDGEDRRIFQWRTIYAPSVLAAGTVDDCRMFPVRPISAPFTLHCPFLAVPSKIYLAMLQRVMPFAEKYFARPLGSEGILSLSLHHSAREGRPQGH